MTVNFMNLAMYNWVGTKPLIGVWLNRSEMANELIVTTVCFHLNFFTDWMSDESAK